MDGALFLTKILQRYTKLKLCSCVTLLHIIFQVSQEEVDFPLHHPDKPFPDAYPPRIVLQALPLIHNPQTTTCSLKVLGITENVEFNLMLSKGEERSIAGRYFKACMTRYWPVYGSDHGFLSISCCCWHRAPYDFWAKKCHFRPWYATAVDLSQKKLQGFTYTLLSFPYTVYVLMPLYVFTSIALLNMVNLGVAGCQMVPASQDQRTACLTPRKYVCIQELRYTMVLCTWYRHTKEHM